MPARHLLFGDGSKTIFLKIFASGAFRSGNCDRRLLTYSVALGGPRDWESLIWGGNWERPANPISSTMRCMCSIRAWRGRELYFVEIGIAPTITIPTRTWMR